MGFMSSFEECFNSKIDGKFEQLPERFKDEQSREAYKDFSQKESIATLKLFENKYSCSGFCDVPLFYFSKPVTDGPPSRDCAEAVIEDLTDSVEISVFALLGAITFWMAALAAIPNCCGQSP